MNISKLNELKDATVEQNIIDSDIEAEIDDTAQNESSCTINDIPGKPAIARTISRKITYMNSAAAIIGSWPLKISDGLIETK